MNRIEEQLKKLRDINLPDEARARMRAELFSYAEMHAISSARPAVRSPFTALRLRLSAGFTAAALLVVALGGTAYASESALPGDTLYPVKVTIAEPLQTVLVPSDRGKAAWHAILAERRLEETAQLAAAGRLSSETQDDLAVSFADQVSASEESAERLEKGGDALGSLSARSDLEARLAAHAQILAVIDAHFAAASTTDAKRTHAALSRMLALVEGHEHAVSSSRIALEDAIAPGAADSSSEATSTAVAIALSAPPARHAEPAHLKPREAPAAQVQTAAAARTTEVEDIIERHAALLMKFLPVASTTATSTATSTASTTEEAAEHGKLDEEDQENMN